MIVLVVSVAALGAAVSGLQAAGVLVVAAGVLLVRGLGPGEGRRPRARARRRRLHRRLHARRRPRPPPRRPDRLPRRSCSIVAAMPYAAIVGPAAMRARVDAAGRARGRADVRRLRARPGGAGARGGGARRRAARDERGHGRDRRRGLGALEGAGHARAGRGAGRGRASPRSRSASDGGWVGRRSAPDARASATTTTRARRPALHSTTERAAHARPCTPPRRDVLVDPDHRAVASRARPGRAGSAS